MHLPDCSTLDLSLDAGVLSVTLDRPEVRNAMSLDMVAELRSVLDAAEAARGVRAIVLRGAGGTFCAGGDVKDMHTTLATPEHGRRGRVEDWSRSFGEMLRRFDAAPQVVVAAVQGPAMGGGLGLVCISDVALATEDARFGLPETTLGLVPAQITPFVVRRIGLPQARRLALTGVSFGGREARELGLVHQVAADADDLDARLVQVLAGIRRCAPGANAATKRLLGALTELEPDRVIGETARVFADALLGPEGREGTRALVEKRRPLWASDREPMVPKLKES